MDITLALLLFGTVALWFYGTGLLWRAWRIPRLPQWDWRLIWWRIAQGTIMALVIGFGLEAEELRRIGLHGHAWIPVFVLWWGDRWTVKLTWDLWLTDWNRITADWKKLLP